MQTTPAALQMPPGAMQTMPGVMQTASGAMQTTPGVMQTTPGVMQMSSGVMQMSSASPQSAPGAAPEKFDVLRTRRQLASIFVERAAKRRESSKFKWGKGQNGRGSGGLGF